MSACILPIAPEFQDPPGTRNYAPVIANTTPAAGTRTTLNRFSVTVSDPNERDTLHVRWVVDYPPYSENTRTVVADMQVSNSPNGQDVQVELGCSANTLARIMLHQVMVIVGDQPFTSPGPENNLAAVAKPGLTSVANWTMDLPCL